MDTTKWWTKHYANGGMSGLGSRGDFAEWKSFFLNLFVKKCGIKSVIEFGCGDGFQLSLAEYPKYIGYDVAPDALQRCRSIFREDVTKTFIDQYSGQRADLSLSIDVAYHLVEDEVYEQHMADLFAAANRFVVIYTAPSSQHDMEGHIRYRPLEGWDKKIENRVVDNGCAFYIFNVEN